MRYVTQIVLLPQALWCLARAARAATASKAEVCVFKTFTPPKEGRMLLRLLLRLSQIIAETSAEASAETAGNSAAP